MGCQDSELHTELPQMQQVTAQNHLNSLTFASQVELISSVKTPRDLAKVNDADWVASDKPALACADGCLRVMDLMFQHGSAPVCDYQLQGGCFNSK